MRQYIQLIGSTAALPKGAADTAPDALTRQIGHQVGHHTHRADTGAAAAVRDAEGLVQVQVAHVAAKFAGCGQADQRVHVGTVHINTPAVAVHQRAQFLDAGLEHAVGAGVGDHDRGQVGAVLLTLGLEVGHVDVAVGVTRRDHHLHADHGGAGGVGAVRAARDQADVAVALAARFVVAPDGHHAGVFALAAGVGLQADAGVTGGLAEPGAQLLVELGVTRALVLGAIGVDVGKLGPGDRDHLAGGVELHGATAQRDHGAVQRQVEIGQAADVAQHAGLAVVGVEHRVRQVAAGAQQGGGQQAGRVLFEVSHLGQGLAGLGKEAPELFHVGARGGFIERHAERLV